MESSLKKYKYDSDIEEGEAELEEIMEKVGEKIKRNYEETMYNHEKKLEKIF